MASHSRSRAICSVHIADGESIARRNSSARHIRCAGMQPMKRGRHVADQGGEEDVWVIRTDVPGIWAVTTSANQTATGRLRDLRSLAAELSEPGTELTWHWPDDIQSVFDEVESQYANIDAAKARLAALRRQLAVELRGPENAPREKIEDVAAVLEVSKQRASELVKEGRATERGRLLD